MFKSSFYYGSKDSLTQKEQDYVYVKLGSYPEDRYQQEKTKGRSEDICQNIYIKEVYALIVEKLREIEYYNKAKFPDKKEQVMDAELMRIYDKIIAMTNKNKTL